MLIQELQIEGFRSLKSVTWKPGRLNVLIGPNGGGKSNLLRALDLLRVAATGGLRDAILRMGGMAPLVWDGQARAILFRLRLGNKNSIPLSYDLELSRLGNTGSFIISAEHLTRGDAMELSSLSLLQVIRSPLGTLGELDSETLLSQSPKHILPPPHFHPEPLDTRTAMNSWSIYNDVRVDQEAEIRRAAVTRAERRVAADGQNLIAVLHTLYENDRAFEDFVDQAMGAAFPDDFDKLTFPPAEDGRTQMRVRRKHRKRADNAADLSDGTLRFLLLIAILGSSDPAPLIAIDEPETGLHPRMLPIIAEIAANAAMKTQVIFTTHSPNLLDAFSDDLPTTTIVTSSGAETELKTIGGKELARWVKDYSLSRFAFSGEADAVL